MVGEFDRIRVQPLSEARSKAAAAARMREVVSHVDAAIRDAQARGEFDNLPGAGKPIEGLGEDHDPDWWIKRLVERERIAVLPPSIQLRKDDADLDDRLDELHTEDAARELVEDFNARVLRARYSTPSGPPLITMTRDVEETLAAWRARRDARLAAQRESARVPIGADEAPMRRRGRMGSLLHRLVRRR